MHYVYLLKYNDEAKYYVGCTSNLKKRLAQHKNGDGAKTTKGVPDPAKWRPAYAEIYQTKEAAYTREKKLKQYGSALQRLKKRI
jgi:predicted GIY-YIG superfamily endonuclease